MKFKFLGVTDTEIKMYAELCKLSSKVALPRGRMTDGVLITQTLYKGQSKSEVLFSYSRFCGNTEAVQWNTLVRSA